jgi:hypothetical protein
MIPINFPKPLSCRPSGVVVSIPWVKKKVLVWVRVFQSLNPLAMIMGLNLALARVRRKPKGWSRVSVPWQKMQWIARWPQAS